MALFEVSRREIVEKIVAYNVTADSPEEAQKKVERGAGTSGGVQRMSDDDEIIHSAEVTNVCKFE